jgi:lysyl-tRNA synthetase class II
MPRKTVVAGSLNDEFSVRSEKLQQLRQDGIQPYPERFVKTHQLVAVTKELDGTLNVVVAGRIVSI